jgi:hypothetical protein
MSNCGKWKPVELSWNAKGLTKADTISLFDGTTKPLGSRPLASPLTISGLLTLLSKCFSTFPQGTCLLSISRQYLAMDGGYHPVCALLPKSVTQSNNTVRMLWMPKTGLSPSVACLSRHLRHPSILAMSMMHNSKQRKPLGFTSRAVPFSLAAIKGIPVGFYSSA